MLLSWMKILYNSRDVGQQSMDIYIFIQTN